VLIHLKLYLCVCTNSALQNESLKLTRQVPDPFTLQQSEAESVTSKYSYDLGCHNNYAAGVSTLLLLAITVAAGTGSALMGGVTLAAGDVDQFASST
jgi:hypothetical protein